MQFLLDTHVLIWLLEGNKNLSNVAKSTIEDDNNSLYLSVASLWEITIKLSLGKLDLQISVEDMVESFLIPGGIEILPIEIRHLSILRDLPLHHRDPFDRIIIAQAKADELTLISTDGVFVHEVDLKENRYSLNLLW
jgi:PIN domain nuclease of toxin-antitoxin system